MSVQIAQGALVCEERVELVGDVTIGTRTLVHPSVKIIAEAGPVIIGENNLIEEQTVIINKYRLILILLKFLDKIKNFIKTTKKIKNTLVF